MITLDRALSLFNVDLLSGRVYWRTAPKCHAEVIGKEAGCARQCSSSDKSYWVIKVDGKAVKRGRLIYFIAHGKWPSPCVDHVNGNSLDDRISNLRAATKAQNAWNHKKRKRRIQLPMGVRPLSSGRFQARIAVNNRMIHLGAFDTVEEARATYLQKRQEAYGEFA